MRSQIVWAGVRARSTVCITEVGAHFSESWYGLRRCRSRAPNITWRLPDGRSHRRLRRSRTNRGRRGTCRAICQGSANSSRVAIRGWADRRRPRNLPSALNDDSIGSWSNGPVRLCVTYGVHVTGGAWQRGDECNSTMMSLVAFTPHLHFSSALATPTGYRFGTAWMCAGRSAWGDRRTPGRQKIARHEIVE